MGQNVLVSADVSTSYIDVDPKLSDGAIDDINAYIERLNLISQSSTSSSSYSWSRSRIRFSSRET